VLNRSYIWHFKCHSIYLSALWDLWMGSLERLRDVKGNGVYIVLRSLNACTCDCKPLEKYNGVELFTTHRVMESSRLEAIRALVLEVVGKRSVHCSNRHFDVWQFWSPCAGMELILDELQVVPQDAQAGPTQIQTDAGRLKFLCFTPRAKVCRSNFMSFTGHVARLCRPLEMFTV